MRRIEVGAHAEKDAGDRADTTKAMPMASAKMRSVVDAHELRDLEIVGRGAECAAERGAVEDAVEQHDDGDRGGERQMSGIDADRDAAAERQRGGFDVRRRRGAWLSAENTSSRPFWMMIDSPKVTSSGGRMSRPSVAVEQHLLQRVAERRT